MSSYDSLHDELKFEKADAMRRLRSLQLAGALVLVLVLLCFARIYGFKGLASDHPSALKFCVFLLIHVIVLLVCPLSSDNSDKKNDAAVEPHLDDVDVSFSFSASAVPSRSNTTVGGQRKQMMVLVSPAPEILSRKVASRNKQIVVCENVEYSRTEGKHRVRGLAVVANDCGAVKAQEEKVKHYRRSRSVLSTREKTSRLRG